MQVNTCTFRFTSSKNAIKPSTFHTKRISWIPWGPDWRQRLNWEPPLFPQQPFRWTLGPLSADSCQFTPTLSAHHFISWKKTSFKATNPSPQQHRAKPIKWHWLWPDCRSKTQGCQGDLRHAHFFPWVTARPFVGSPHKKGWLMRPHCSHNILLLFG